MGHSALSVPKFPQISSGMKILHKEYSVLVPSEVSGIKLLDSNSDCITSRVSFRKLLSLTGPRYFCPQNENSSFITGLLR